MAPRWLSDKESACQCRRRGFDPWVKKISWSRKWQPTPAFLPGKFQCTEELGCCRGSCSPWSCKELDMMKHAGTWLPSTTPRSSGGRKYLQVHLIPLFIHPTNATVWPFHASPYAGNKTDKLPAPTQLYPLQQSKTQSQHIRPRPALLPRPRLPGGGGSEWTITHLRSAVCPTRLALNTQLIVLSVLPIYLARKGIGHKRQNFC